MGIEFIKENIVKLPGLADVHVHLREPGFSYKERIYTGSRAAARGGYTAVCTMPNLDPCPDSKEHLKVQTDIIAKDSVIDIIPYGTITKGEMGDELSDMEDLAPFIIAFSDDGRGVQAGSMMKEAMLKAKSLGKMIVAHCEDNSLLDGGYIHKGKYALEHGHRGICSESEWKQIERDLVLAKETGCAYHICHISTKESVQLIRDAKKDGVDVSCETAPHYLLLDDSFLEEDGRFKMNPPLRDRSDREALIEGLADGTIDLVATDHAPHSKEEKSKGLEKSAMGISGIETAFPLLYTYLVKKQIISLEKLLDLMCYSPRKRFGIKSSEGFTVFDLGNSYRIDPAGFISMGKSTPFAGWEVYGKCLLTVCGKNAAYIDKDLKEEEWNRFCSE
ncbi:MAG: dihydroorotase [Firmicutes bacterium]|nr:dihydroorotase [Bacillota bacterium]